MLTVVIQSVFLIIACFCFIKQFSLPREKVAEKWVYGTIVMVLSALTVAQTWLR